MKLNLFMSALTLLIVTFLFGCSKENDDFSSPTSKALDLKFGSGLPNEKLRDISIDANGNIYVTSKTKIFKLDANGAATVFAGSSNSAVIDGQGTSAAFRSIGLISFDKDGNIYAHDSLTIRKITPNGLVATPAITVGDIIGDVGDPEKPFNRGIVEKDGALYIGYYTVILKIYNGEIMMFAGSRTLQQGFADGKSFESKFKGLRTLILDPSGENLIVADVGSLRKISLADTLVTTFTGTEAFGKADGSISEATYQTINDLVVTKAGDYYLSAFNTIRKISASGQVTTIAGPIKSDGSTFYGGGLALDKEEKFLYVTDVKVPALLIKIDLSKL